MHELKPMPLANRCPFEDCEWPHGTRLDGVPADSLLEMEYWRHLRGNHPYLATTAHHFSVPHKLAATFFASDGREIAVEFIASNAYELAFQGKLAGYVIQHIHRKVRERFGADFIQSPWTVTVA